MNDLEYTSLFQLIKDNSIHKDEIIKQYMLLLSQLTEAPVLSNEEFTKKLLEITNIGCINVCYFKTEENIIHIIGSGTIIFEPKIIRNGQYVGHIEDIIVDEKYRSIGIAKIIINKLINLANEKKCYKIILDCKYNLSDFYEKLGFEKKGIQMAKYFE